MAASFLGREKVKPGDLDFYANAHKSEKKEVTVASRAATLNKA